jgi:hypothetical protein
MTATADLTAGTGSVAETEAQARLDEHAAAFAELLAEAERLRRAGDDEAAADAIHAAAGAAWSRHPGIHASARLERLVGSLKLPPRPGDRVRLPVVGRRPRVLHVLTTAYATGGHTRLVERLVRGDPERAHSGVVLAQDGDVPARLRGVIAASGGSLTVLERGGHLARAAALRDLARDADLAITYPHPDDVITAAAFADEVHRPPVAMLNHADHTFWLGATTPDLLVNLRQSGADLAARRRGIGPARSAILPAPLDAPSTRPDRAEARRLLGMRDDEIVLVCAGSHWKFDPEGATGLPRLPDLVAPLVARDARLRCFVFGPIDTGPWVDAARMTGGRMRAMGNRLDLGLYQRAADIYLDAFPVGSTYSLLEAAALGAPVLSYFGWPSGAETLSIDSPGVGDARLVATDPHGYIAALERLIDDPAAREDAGARLAAQVAALHVGEGWRVGLERVLAAVEPARAAHADTPSIGPEVDIRTADPLDRALVLVPVRSPVLPERAVVHVALTSPRAACPADRPAPQGPNNAQETAHA